MIVRLLRDSAIYLVPTVLARGIGLLLLPVYTRYLAPGDYGVLEMLGALYALLNLVLPLEVSQAVARFSYESDRPAARSSSLSTAFWFTCLVFSAWAVVSFAAPGALSRLLFHQEYVSTIVRLAGIAFLFNALLYLALNQLRINMQSVHYAIVSTLFGSVSAAVSVTMVVWLRHGVVGVIYGQLAGSICGLLAAVAFLSTTSPIRLFFSRSELGTLARFSTPLVASSLAVYASQYADRWIVSGWNGMGGVGVYGVALRIAGVITLFTGSVQLALTPLIYRHYREPGTPVAVERLFRYYLLAMFLTILVLASFSSEIIGLLVGARFQNAAPLVGPVLLTALFMGVNVFAPGLALARRTPFIAMANILGAAVNVTLCLLMVPRFGVPGAAWSAVGGAAVAMGLRFTWSQKHYIIVRRWGRYVGALGVLAVALGSQLGGAVLGGQRVSLVVITVALLTLILIDRPTRGFAGNG